MTGAFPARGRESLSGAEARTLLSACFHSTAWKGMRINQLFLNDPQMLRLSPKAPQQKLSC